MLRFILGNFLINGIIHRAQNYSRNSERNAARKRGDATFDEHCKAHSSAEHQSRDTAEYIREYARSQRFGFLQIVYILVVKNVLTTFKQNIQPFKLIRKARLEYIYLDYLNKKFTEKFGEDNPNLNAFTPFLYAGMLFNVSMLWLDGDCEEPIDKLSNMIVNAIYFE